MVAINEPYPVWRIIQFYPLVRILTNYLIWRIVRLVMNLVRDPKQLGNIIRRVRKKQGLSQSGLGAKAGLRQGTISVMENGNPAARLETILSVLTALDLELQITPRSKGWNKKMEGLL
jgi:HTH-type transcriptional regulator/antitoxin HipB